MHLRSNWLFWIPIFISFGIFIYFAVPIKTDTILIIGLISTFLALLAFYKNKLIAVYFISVVIGFYASVIRTDIVYAPSLRRVINDVWISGKIEEIQYANIGGRITLSDVYSKDLRDDEKDVKLKITAKSSLDSLNIGDVVLFKGTLMPPMPPSIPGGFDYRRFAYYQQIGGTGYAISKVVVKRKGGQHSNLINEIRNSAISRISTLLPQPAASVASGMLLGDTSYLKQKVYDDIKISGIAHVIAISGMHMVVVVSIIFLTSRWLFGLSEYISLNFNTKKIAAVFSIIGSLFYLMLAGNPVSAQRAYIMSSMVLLAIILDRKNHAIHSLSIACIILLLVSPESLLNPSLQMSVAACFGLIWSYSFFNKYLSNKKHDRFWQTALQYILNISFSTMVAGIFTAPFIIYHFHQFSTYSMLANLICIPLTDFMLMPLGMIGLLLMPFGLDKMPFLLMEYGIDFMLSIARMVASLPLSSLFVPAIQSYTMLLFSYGVLIWCVSERKVRLCGVVMVAAAILSLFWIRMPDAIVDSEGRIFAVCYEGRYYFSNMKTARFIRKVWQEFVGENNPVSIEKGNIPGCNPERCLISKGRYNVLITSVHESECYGYDLIINLSDSNFHCNVYMITRENLNNCGAHSIWISGDEIVTKSSLGCDEERKF